MKITFITIALLLGYGFVQAQHRYAFNVGDRYNFTFVMKQTSTQTIMGADQRIVSLMSGEYVLEVDSLTASGARIMAQYTRLKNTMESAGSVLEMDSEATEDKKAENKIFKAMMNKPFYIFMDRYGFIEKFADVENLWSGFEDTGLDERVLTTMRGTLEQLMGSEVLKSTFEQAFVVYPEKNVQPGDTWIVRSSAPINFSVTSQTVWTLAAVTEATATLSAEGVYRTDKDKIVTLTSGVKAKTDLSGPLTIKGLADITTGWPKQVEVLSSLSGRMTLLAGSIIDEDIDIPMKITIETTCHISKME